MEYARDKLTHGKVSHSNKNYQKEQQGIQHDGINIFCYLYLFLFTTIKRGRDPPLDSFVQKN